MKININIHIFNSHEETDRKEEGRREKREGRRTGGREGGRNRLGDVAPVDRMGVGGGRDIYVERDTHTVLASLPAIGSPLGTH